jgi:putative transposase
MADQRDEAVRKGAHCAWQIHYHIVFPVKYRKALLDEVVTTIVQEMVAEIAERFPIEMEAIGTDKNHLHLLCSAHPKVAQAGLCKYTRASRCRRSFVESLLCSEYCGAGSFGPMGTMWPQ